MEINYEKLSSINRAERDNFSLQELDENFVEKFHEYIKEKRELAEEAEKSEDSLSKDMTKKSKIEIKNAKKIFREIFERREKKIINRALLSMKTDSNVIDIEKMLPHEIELFERTIELIKESRESIRRGKSLKRPKTSKTEEQKPVKLIHITEDIPGFVWKDGKIVGPFRKGQQLNSLPKDVLDILVKQRKCEIR